MQAWAVIGWLRQDFLVIESDGNVRKAELESAAREMDARLYQQEFRASFEELRSGRVYRDFDRTLDVKPIEYDERFDLCWTLDFNIDPASSLICQVIHDRIIVLDEIVLIDNAPTYDVCREFLRRVKPLQDARTLPGRMDIRVYGDSSGHSRKSSSKTTDWQIIQDFFADHDNLFRYHTDIPSKNPDVADRINRVNAKIANAKGARSLTVSPRCQQLIRDLEQVSWKVDANGNLLREIDESNPKRKHTSDALGYLINQKFPMLPKSGERPYFIA